MNKHKKKMIAPIIVTILVLAILAVYAWVYAIAGLPFIIRVVFVLVFIAIGVAMIFTLISRIKEIKGGEEDDLDNY